MMEAEGSSETLEKAFSHGAESAQNVSM